MKLFSKKILKFFILHESNRLKKSEKLYCIHFIFVVRYHTLIVCGV